MADLHLADSVAGAAVVVADMAADRVRTRAVVTVVRMAVDMEVVIRRDIAGMRFNKL